MCQLHHESADICWQMLLSNARQLCTESAICEWQSKISLTYDYGEEVFRERKVKRRTWNFPTELEHMRYCLRRIQRRSALPGISATFPRIPSRINSAIHFSRVPDLSRRAGGDGKKRLREIDGKIAIWSSFWFDFQNGMVGNTVFPFRRVFSSFAVASSGANSLQFSPPPRDPSRQTRARTFDIRPKIFTASASVFNTVG